MSDLQTIIETNNALQKQIAEVSAEALIEYFSPIFEADDRIKAIVWGQWAPYFNPCEFGVYGEDPVRGSVAETPACDLDTWNEQDPGDPLYEPVKKSYDRRDGTRVDYIVYRPVAVADLAKRASAMLHALPRSFLLKVSEDGVIQVTREGVTIHEADHD